jgi:hypothetical protein
MVYGGWGAGSLYLAHVERLACVRGVFRGSHAGSTGHVSCLAYDTSRHNGARPAEALPERAAVPATEKASKSSRADKVTRKSVYDKLSLNKLTISRDPPRRNQLPPQSPNRTRRKPSVPRKRKRVRLVSPCFQASRERPPGKEAPSKTPPSKNLLSKNLLKRKPLCGKLPRVARTRQLGRPYRTTPGCCSRYRDCGWRT